MNLSRSTRLSHFASLVLGGLLFQLPLLAFQRGPPAADEGIEVLTRGPVHEAFAETISFDPEPGIVAAKEPPAAIEELPPEQRPEGTNVTWIPGYWAWDDERNDYLWISGIWRDLPPGRQWVPGYWSPSSTGFQWTSGYWADAAARETQYLPEPPQSVENGPNTDAPSPDHTWLPGCWIWQQTRYVWRPGYWEIAQPNWVWVPSYYVWAPRGYLFVDGYWDYSINRRGVLFAPVYFQNNIYSRRGFSYSPASVINPAVFTNHLFVRPGYGHYYYGDFYAANYSRAGFMPGYSLYSGRQGYDPIYAHQRWEHRQDQNWERQTQANFQRLRDDEHSRPPRTWADQRQRDSDPNNQNRFLVAAPLDQLAKSKNSPLRFQTLDQAERKRVAQNGQEMQKFRQEREQLERHVTARPVGEGAADKGQPTPVKFPTSPIAAKDRGELGREHAPPKSHTMPMPDAKLAPQPRTARPLDKAISRQPREKDPFSLQDEERPPMARGEQPPTTKRPQVDPDRPMGRSPLAPNPGVDDPRTKPRPDRPDPRPEQPKAQPKPRVEETAPKKAQPQPRVEQPVPKKAEPQPRTEPPRQPQTVQKPVAPPRTEPRPQQPMPRNEQPKSQPQPGPKLDQPMAQTSKPSKPSPNPGQAGPGPRGPNPDPAKDREKKPKKD